MKLQYTVLPKDNEKEIKHILKQELQISQRLLIKLKQNKKIYLNGNEVPVNTRASVNDLIEVIIDFEETNENIIPQNLNVEIIYNDPYMIAFNKPSGMVVHPTCYHHENTLSNHLKYILEKENLKVLVRPVIRIDRDTTGIVLFAKNEYIQECLVRQMNSGDFIKEYLGVVEGNLESDSGVIDFKIARAPNSIILREVSEKGETAITEYTVLKKYEEYTLVKFKLLTGRTHQIRVHTKAIGHPLLGDGLYNGNNTNLIDRQALHSYLLKFIHPISKEMVSIVADIPQDLKELLK